ADLQGWPRHWFRPAGRNQCLGQHREKPNLKSFINNAPTLLPTKKGAEAPFHPTPDQILKLPTNCFNRAACCSRSPHARKVECKFSTPSWFKVLISVISIFSDSITEVCSSVAVATDWFIASISPMLR